ncbi:ATR2 [Scenedesmus sp. PABB004]|nr:ATR2 [Scenedesmus sp. PABB004]
MAATAEAPAAPAASTAATPANSSLYVGDLDREATEASLYELFSQVGPVASIRVCRDAVTRRSLGYAYVNYNSALDTGAAERALEALNYTPVNGRPIRIMWSHRDPAFRKSGVGNIFIKNLDKSIDNKALHDTFSQFGTIWSCKVAQDATGASKGYGFVHFETEEGANLAIEKVNGMQLADKIVYVGPFLKRTDRGPGDAKFTNVYVKNLSEEVDDAGLKALAEEYGEVVSAIVMTDDKGKSKCFGFINYAEPESAAKAVDDLTGKEVGGKSLYAGRAQKKAEREAMLRNQFEEKRAERLQKYQGMNLYIKNLHDDVNDDTLREEFAPFGAITSAKVMSDEKGKSKGFGFVCYTSHEEATRAVTEMNGKMLKGKPLYVALAQRKEVRRVQLTQQLNQQRMALGGGARGPMGPGVMFPPGGPGAPMFYQGMPGAPRGPGAPGMMYGAMMGAGRMAGRGPRGPPGAMMMAPPMGGPPGALGLGPRGRGGRAGVVGGRGLPGRGPGGFEDDGGRGRGFGGRGAERGRGRAERAAPGGRGAGAPAGGEGVQLSLPAMLANATPEQQKQILGERLFPQVQALQPELAGKITGMLLEMDNSEVLLLLDNQEALVSKVDEAIEQRLSHTAAPPGAAPRQAAPGAAPLGAMEPAAGAGAPAVPGLALASLVLLAITLLILYLKPKSSLPPKLEPRRRASTAADEDPSRKRVRILYGTQTGTAERFSKQLGNELRRKYADASVEVVDIENYRAEARLPKEHLVIFLMATYGDGEPTDNAADFYSWICTEVEDVENGAKDTYLEGVRFGVFGLGNKQYEHFNAVGKRMFKNMEALGATPLCRRGDGDDDDSIDDDFEKWCTDLFAALEAEPELLGAAAGEGEGGSTVATYRVELKAPGTKAASPFHDGSGHSAHDPYWATVTEVRELHTPASERSCVHVELDISGNKQLKYETGDHVGMYARNGDAVVAQAAALLGLPLDTTFTLHTDGEGASGDLDPPFPGPIALSTALAYFADLLSSPRKDSLLALASCAADAAQAARLSHLASAGGKADYNEYIAKQHRSLLEVMSDFPSAVPSLGLFFGSVAPRLAPRFYSISSGAAAHPRALHVTCAVVRDVMPTGRVHDGVASSYLQGAAAGERVPVFVRRSTFKLPEDGRAPIVMIGPGTGLAPFRGFLQDRAALVADMAELGPAVLFFGCRSRAHDYIYEAELAAAVEGGALSALHVAFSRAGPQKDYVQHHLAAAGAEVWGLLQQPGASVYVCGDASAMAKDVHRALIAVAQRHGGLTTSQAEAWVKRLGDSGRYHKDVW